MGKLNILRSLNITQCDFVHAFREYINRRLSCEFNIGNFNIAIRQYPISEIRFCITDVTAPHDFTNYIYQHQQDDPIQILLVEVWQLLFSPINFITFCGRAINQECLKDYFNILDDKHIESYIMKLMVERYRILSPINRLNKRTRKLKIGDVKIVITPTTNKSTINLIKNDFVLYSVYIDNKQQDMMKDYAELTNNIFRLYKKYKDRH